MPTPPGDSPSTEPTQPPPQTKPASKRRKPTDSKPQEDDPAPTPPPPPPVLQPYPNPYYMGSHYPNGTPYPPYPYMSGSYQPPPNPNMPLPPHPHHYAYSPHPTYYAGPQPVMMYGAPPPHPAAVPPEGASASPVSQPDGKKRKRKSSKDKGSDDEAAAIQASSAQSSDVKKRTKTQRACDSCRTRKIRCDVIPETEPPICQHCKQYNFECTFFLPITETRFKKKKLEEEAERDKSRSSQPDHRRESGVLGYDARYNHTFEVTAGGDGLIQVQKPVNEEKSHALNKPTDYRVEREIIEQLINAYFTDVAPLLPVITQQEFLAHSSPPPILLYSMCLVAAARREIPQQVFDSIRYHVNSIIKTDDVLSTASIVNVQALLILCMTGDSHSQFVPTALSALWIRLGTAIRMAQDLGLHRCESVKQNNVELRRRLWGACLICDRWISLTYGHPYMIDIQDCDARLPSSGDPNDLYMDELVRLSIILGRVQKAIYTPAGLTVVTDNILNQILTDLEAWRENLPDNLQFKGPETSRTAGLLYLLYVCVSMMFWRVFMRISYSCPAHLKFGLTVEQWSSLVTHTGQAIDWLDANERIYDVWLVVAYAAASCGFVQYHTFVRRKDAGAEQKLRKLRDCVRRWEKSISPDHMSARRKTAEIMALLYEATQGDPGPMEAPALNPTGGVTPKQPLGGLDYHPDPTRPGKGVFIARGKAKGAAYRDVPAGTIVPSTSDDDDESEVNDQIVQPSGSTMVNFTPLGGNVNPAMNVQSVPNNQVINILDTPQASNTLAEFAMADTGFLEGIPTSMFDWGQWESFFARFNSASTDPAAAAAAAAGGTVQQVAQAVPQQPPS
ncbi:hypothetical protein VKT23_004355 [Stygiomarasmius scandens]|uniref:Zn(2)-C6 fungal-type domain-containing protein n=1 Tax=Marasmiellus scandens TaxID=2682957 RepID=A0ABR1JYG0_9AGAR